MNPEEIVETIHSLETATFPPEAAWNRSAVEEEEKNRDSLILMINNQGEISEAAANDSGKKAVGYLICRVLLEDATIDVLRIAVLPEFRGQGFGTKLLEKSFEIGGLYMDRPAFAILEVSEKNSPAVALYKKIGFETIHRRKSYYRDGSDAIIMRHTLPPL